MKTIIANSGLECRARFYAATDRAQVTPTTADWRLVDDATGTVVQDWTALEIAAGDDPYALVEVPGSLNTVTSRNYRRLRLTVAADRGTAREYAQAVVYQVNRR